MHLALASSSRNTTYSPFGRRIALVDSTRSSKPVSPKIRLCDEIADNGQVAQAQHLHERVCDALAPQSPRVGDKDVVARDIERDRLRGLVSVGPFLKGQNDRAPQARIAGFPVVVQAQDQGPIGFQC